MRFGIKKGYGVDVRQATFDSKVEMAKIDEIMEVDYAAALVFYVFGCQIAR